MTAEPRSSLPPHLPLFASTRPYRRQLQPAPCFSFFTFFFFNEMMSFSILSSLMCVLA